MTVKVRYIVDDAAAAVDFYTEMLGFKVDMQFGAGFAAVSRGELQLLMNKPGAGGAGQSDSQGRAPEPGGWNRIQIETDDLEGLVARLRARDAHFRSDIIEGNGGRQILLEDPSGNLIELFEAPVRQG